MIEYDTLTNNFYEQEVVVAKLLAAYRVVINRQQILEHLDLESADIITDAFDYIHAIYSNDYTVILPKGYSIKPGQKETKAFVTNSNEPLLLWRIIGKSEVKLKLKDFSNDDETSLLARTLAKYNKNPGKYIDQSVRSVLYSHASTFNIDNETKSLSQSQDKHKLWSYYKIYAAIMLGGSKALELNQRDQASLIFGLLYFLQINNNNPYVAFALLDFNLRLVEVNNNPDNNGCFSLLIDVVWFQLAKIFSRLVKKELLTSYSSFYEKELKFDLDYLEYFFSMMLLYTYNLLNSQYSSTHTELQPLVKSQLKLILVNPSIASKCFLLLNDLLEGKINHLSFLPDTLYSKKSSHIQFSIISIYNLFGNYLQKQKVLKVFNFFCSTLDCYSREVDCATYFHNNLHSQVIATNQELEKVKALKSEETSVKDRLTSDLAIATAKIVELQASINQQDLKLKFFDKKIGLAEARLASIARSNKLARRLLRKDFAELKDIYRQFKRSDCKSRDRILDLLSKGKLYCILIYPKIIRFSDEPDFNLYRIKYLLFIFRFYNKMFHNIRYGLEDSPAKEYYLNIAASLLNYKNVRKLLKTFLVAIDNPDSCTDVTRHIKILSNYLIDIGDNIELTRHHPSKFMRAQELAKYYISFMSEMAQVFRSDPGFIEISKKSTYKP